MSLIDLPTDLWYHILEHLDPADGISFLASRSYRLLGDPTALRILKEPVVTYATVGLILRKLHWIFCSTKGHGIIPLFEAVQQVLGHYLHECLTPLAITWATSHPGDDNATALLRWVWVHFEKLPTLRPVRDLLNNQSPGVDTTTLRPRRAHSLYVDGDRLVLKCDFRGPMDGSWIPGGVVQVCNGPPELLLMKSANDILDMQRFLSPERQQLSIRNARLRALRKAHRRVSREALRRATPETRARVACYQQESRRQRRQQMIKMKRQIEQHIEWKEEMWPQLSYWHKNRVDCWQTDE